MIKHEGKENYTALRDVLSRNAKKIFSFSGWKAKPFTHEEFWALKDIDFDIEAGDRVGIIGRNGAGKSTLLKILSRITEPTNGTIKIKGRIASLLEVGTGFHPELSGRENIFLNGAILGMSRNEIKKHFDAIVDFAEVEKFLDTPVKRYSSGMYVRLAFAVAAHLEPEILIVDEVLAVGDAQFQKKCLGKMEDVSKNHGRTVLFVSHNMGVVSHLCNRGVLLKNGQLEFQGKASETLACYMQQQSSSDATYTAKESKVSGKINHIIKVSIINNLNEIRSDFSFEDTIQISFSAIIHEKTSNLQIGIGIQDKMQNRVTTFLKNVDHFIADEQGIINGIVELQGGILAPNNYSIVVAIWSKQTIVYDIVENICPFKVHDNGTELSQFEGTDYGSVIIPSIWKNA